MRKHTMMILALAAVAGCSGTEGTASGWTLRGTAADPTLHGGTVMALSSDAQVTQSPIGANGEFAVSMEGDRAYSIHFLQGGQFAAVMTFAGSAWNDGQTSVLQLPASLANAAPKTRAGWSASALTEEDAGESELALGTVTVEDGRATPENNPLASIDNDGDGTPDLSDPDDDGDGIDDALESEPPIDTSALGFQVRRVEPAPLETGVDPDERIEVRFNQPVDVASVTAETIQLQDSQGIAVSAEIEFDDELEEVRLLPLEDLSLGETYRIEVSGIRSATGDHPAASHASTFRVESEDDIPEPFLQVNRIRPGHDALDVDVDERIEVRFNHEMEEGGTVFYGAGGLELLDEAGQLVEGVIEMGCRRVRFFPAAPLAPHQQYTVVVGTGLQSDTGLSLDQEVRTSFETGNLEEDELDDADDVDDDADADDTDDADDADDDADADDMDDMDEADDADDVGDADDVDE